MKKQDFLFIILVVVVFLPFFLSDAVYDWYKSFNAEHGMVMSFLKFAILSSLGEVLGLRISAGVYNRKGFGIIPRMVVWGILGMGINAAMIIFSKGVCRSSWSIWEWQMLPQRLQVRRCLSIRCWWHWPYR